MTRDYARNYRPQPKQRNTRVAPSNKSAPGWVWLAAGVLIGSLFTGVLLFKGDTPPAPTGEIAATTEVVEETSPPPPSHKPRFDFYTLLKETEVIVPDKDGNLPPKTVVIPEVKEATTAKEEDKPEAKVVAEKPAATTPATAATKTVVATPVAPTVAPAPTLAPPKPSTPPPSTPAPAATASVPPPTATPPPQDRTVHILQAGSYKNPADADSVRARLLLLNMHATVERVTASGGETWHRVLIGPYANPNDASTASALLRQNGIDSIQLKRKP